jgi:hypothetical protein
VLDAGVSVALQTDGGGGALIGLGMCGIRRAQRAVSLLTLTAAPREAATGLFCVRTRASTTLAQTIWAALTLWPNVVEAFAIC